MLYLLQASLDVFLICCFSAQVIVIPEFSREQLKIYEDRT